jgi:hypothetical protein
MPRQIGPATCDRSAMQRTAGRAGVPAATMRRDGECDSKVQRRGPVVPLGAMHRHQRAQRDPRHAQRIGDDGAMQRLAEEDPAGADGSDDRGRIAARINQLDPGGARCLAPGAAIEALEMRHEADSPIRPGCGVRPATFPRGPPGIRQQHRRVAKAAAFGQTEQSAGVWPAHPVYDPAGIERRQLFIASVTGARCQLQRNRSMPRIEDGADAQKNLGRIVIEEVREQMRPDQHVQLIAEVPCRPPPPLKLDGGYPPGRADEVSPPQPSAARMKPSA